MKRPNLKGQNVVEYTLLMAGAVALAIVALRQGGMVEKAVDRSLDKSVLGVECMALNVCYDPAGCPATCGNGCCEQHAETPLNCWPDCECADPDECNDGNICNGEEECGGDRHCSPGAPAAAGTYGGLCAACDGSGGEIAMADDPACGGIDCGGYNFYHHADTVTCFLRKYADITADRCAGIRACQAPTEINCAAYVDDPAYVCPACQYIADNDCAGARKGQCSNSNVSQTCGTELCDLNDRPCRDYHDVTRYCGGMGYCETAACNSYTNAYIGTYCDTVECDMSDRFCRDYHDVPRYCDGQGACVDDICKDWTDTAQGTLLWNTGAFGEDEICAQCDGGGDKETAEDDARCGVIACDTLNYYEAEGVESPTDTETCYHYEYTNISALRCEGMGDCIDVGTVGDTDCANPAKVGPPAAPAYECGTCRYIAGGACLEKTRGGCSDYPAETRTGICKVCDGSGTEKAPDNNLPVPYNEAGCGTGGNIDCDGLDGYYASGTPSHVDTEYCDYRDYADITSNQCEGMENCKDPNSADCQDYTPGSHLECGTCQYLTGCGGSAGGACADYGDTSYTGVCTVCGGSGGTTKAAVHDNACGTIACSALPSTYSTTSANSAMVEEVCDEQRYETDISTENCKPVGDGTTGACKEANTTDCVPSPYQTTCKMCEYLTGCGGTTPGSCAPYAAGRSCGGGRFCDGSGECVLYSCVGSPAGPRCSGQGDTDDETELTANTAWSPVSSCTAGKCEYTCPGGTTYYNGYCCTPQCPPSSCGVQNNAWTCGTNRDCGACCPNGALNGTEQCDGGSYSCSLWAGTCNAPNCNTLKSPYDAFDGGVVSCNADCTLNVSGCCTAVNGTYGPPSDNVGACNQFQSCKQLVNDTCNGASCTGICPGNQQRAVDCTDAFCCGGGCDPVYGETCTNCPADCGACPVDRTFMVATVDTSHPSGQTTTNTNNQSVSTSAALCATFTVTSVSVTGGGCGNPGTPGNSCTATLSP